MTMVIVVILSVSVVPRFFSTQEYQKRLYYDELLNSVRYARKLSIATGSHIQVLLTANSITLQRRVEGSSCTSGTTFEPIFDPANNTTGYVRTAPADLTLTFSGGWPLFFDGLGRGTMASDCSIITTQTINLTGGKTITVFGETGFVE